MVFVYLLIVVLSLTTAKSFRSWVAYRLGDPTPKNLGRLTINPAAHIDFFSTVLSPFLLLILTSGLLTIGFAKPLSLSPYRFKNPRKGMRLVSLSEPLINLTIALVFLIFLKTGFPFLSDMMIFIAWTNFILAMFNLIPVPPLEGANLLASFLPKKSANEFLKARSFGFVLILFLFLTGV
ncbi:MAG: site-2 protease family protein, partial [Candidatus Omnitrophica bacterium]|nr:site-2 protease family protein [Candidatus Omnitrophota bacterium]